MGMNNGGGCIDIIYICEKETEILCESKKEFEIKGGKYSKIE